MELARYPWQRIAARVEAAQPHRIRYRQMTR